MKRQHLILPAILILALVVRVISLADHSLSYDEAFSVLFAQNDLATMLSGTVSAIEHPLLYYLSLSAWMGAWGESVFMVRLWGVLTGVATIGVVYLIGRDLFSQRMGIAAALLVALAPFHLQYSQEARMYSLLALCLSLVTWFYIKGKDNPLPTSPVDEGGAMSKWIYWLLFGIFAGFAMHTQQLAAFYLLAIGVLPLLQRAWRTFAGVVVGAVIALVIFAPWLINLPQQVAQLNANYWIEEPPIAQPLVSSAIFMGGFQEYHGTQLFIAYGGGFFVVLFALLQSGLFLFNKRRRKSDKSALAMILWLCLAPIAFMWVFSQFVPVYVERALIASMLMLMLLLAWLLTESKMPVVIRGVIAVPIIAVFTVGNLAQWQTDTLPYSPMNDLTAYVEANAQAGDVVVHMNKLTVLPAQVYLPDVPQRFLADVEGNPEDTLDPSTQEVIGVRESACIQVAANGAPRLWFVTLQRAEQEYAAVGDNNRLAQVREWLSSQYVLSETQTFNDVNVHLYYSESEIITEKTCP